MELRVREVCGKIGEPVIRAPKNRAESKEYQSIPIKESYV